MSIIKFVEQVRNTAPISTHKRAVNANGSTLYIDGLVIGDNLKMGASCIVYENVTIEDNVTIKNGCVIEKGATIKAGSFVPRGTYIAEGETYENHLSNGIR